MKDYPEKIEKHLRTIADMNINIQREREELSRIEADFHLEIAEARDENGKPLFSNDTTRKAAFTKGILESPEHTTISQSLEILERDRLYLLALVERLRLEYKLFLLDREGELQR